jgi:hypothetical protein
MNWFQRHLNWTLIFNYAGAWLVAVVLVQILSDTVAILSIFVLAAWSLGVSGWFLKQKGRSLWNLCWMFLGWIGFIIFLCLENRTELKLSTNTFPQADRREEE